MFPIFLVKFCGYNLLKWTFIGSNGKTSKEERQNWEKTHWLKRSFCVINLVHVQIYCNNIKLES